MSHKKKKSQRFTTLRRLIKKPAFIVVGALAATCLVTVPIVAAQSVQQQIDNLNAQNAQSESSINSLQLQASSYQNAINQLQTQINAIETAIAASQSKAAELNTQILADQAQLNQQKQILAADVKAMYVDGQMTTLEELATSKTLSDFVDAETYRNAVDSKVQQTLDTITKLQNQVKDQKQQVDSLLATQQAQQSQLASDQSQQQQLLSYNQAQQNQYNQQIQSNDSQIASLRAQQAAANNSIARSAHVVGASGGSGGACDIGQGNGGYPMAWCNAPMDSMTDANGFLNRECTSYAYWYFTSIEGQTGFSVSGNAGAWWETSNYPAVTWSSSIKVGAIGVEPGTVPINGSGAPVPSLHGSYYGHVMIVQALPGQTYGGQYVPSGYVLVSSMNEDEEGHFMYNLWPVNYLMFINPQ